jgi:hypothetical protein
MGLRLQISINLEGEVGDTRSSNAAQVQRRDAKSNLQAYLTCCLTRSTILSHRTRQRRSQPMTCPKCGREYQNESGTCLLCTAPLIVQRQLENPEKYATSIAPKILGVCSECGTEQLGSVYRIPSAVADFLRQKCTSVFVADRHRCVKRSVAG